jgi:sterol desaturase/sphingolipid hydroxylase (fatty acid hydroxylase superfamily)
MLLFDLAAVIAGTLIVGTLAGYLVHAVSHRRWGGLLYRTHLTHHARHYPPNRLMSEVHLHTQEQGLDWGSLAFGFPALAVICVGVVVGERAGVPVPLLLVAASLLSMLGWLHGYLHDAFHIIGHPFERFAWFRRLREQHLEHHRREGENLGVIWSGWDRVFGTYRRRR